MAVVLETGRAPRWAADEDVGTVGGRPLVGGTGMYLHGFILSS